MRVSLLECDHVDDRHRGIDGDYADMFSGLLARAGAPVELVRYDVCRGVLPASARECDAWLAAGSRRSVYDDEDWIGALSDLVRAVRHDEVPYVGICFGHQLLAHALEGRTERAGGGWGAGVGPMEVCAVEPWMDPPVPSVTLLYLHQDQVTALPPGGVVLGRADHCPVAMMRVGSTMLGIQAHPEFSSGYVDSLLEARVDRIGADATTRARRSLASTTDADRVSRWIVRFLEEAT